MTNTPFKIYLKSSTINKANMFSYKKTHFKLSYHPIIQIPKTFMTECQSTQFFDTVIYYIIPWRDGIGILTEGEPHFHLLQVAEIPLSCTLLDHRFKLEYISHL